MLLSVLSLGFLIGMQHALEADHLAAVSSLVSGKRGIANISWHGAIWGIGHTLTLVIVAGTCLYLKTSMAEDIAERLEFAVGLMLILLGAHVLWRLWRDRIHFGSHHHLDGTKHAHVHSHASDASVHASSGHEHDHVARLPWRTLLVGTIHGMAGSAALVVLAASSLQEPGVGVAYVALFGLGSVLGMAALSAVIALPLTFTAGRMVRFNHVLQLVIGIVTIAVGLSVVHPTAAALLGGA